LFCAVPAGGKACDCSTPLCIIGIFEQ